METITLKKYFARYLDHRTLYLSPATITNYRSTMRAHILPLMGDKLMSEITFDDALNLQKSIHCKGLTNATNNKTLSLLKQVLNYASKGNGSRKVIAQNPLTDFSPLPTQPTEFSYWSKSDIDYFLEHAQDDYYFDLYLLALNTGMRIGELAALKVQSINFHSNIITIKHSLNGSRLGPTKSKTIRHLAMNNTVKKIALARVQNKNAGDYLFITQYGRPIDPSHFTTRKFLPLQKRIGIKNIIRFHDLRHTFASHFAMRGASLYCLKAVLGHKSFGPTFRYIHHSVDYLNEMTSLVEFAPHPSPPLYAQGLTQTPHLSTEMAGDRTLHPYAQISSNPRPPTGFELNATPC